MGRCANNCTFCQGDQCEILMVKCSRCGREFHVTELWKPGGEYMCNKCYQEVCDGKEFAAEGTARRG